MKSPSQTHLVNVPLAPLEGASIEGYYISTIKLFHQKNNGPALLTSSVLLPMPRDTAIPGFLCKAARALLDVTQAWLWTEARVSRKTINDFENGFKEPRAALNNRLRAALEKAGANFIVAESAVGVVVYDGPEARRTRQLAAPTSAD
jgi:DNA-binding XRE family transcriptional regulator